MDLKPELDLKAIFYFTILAEEMHFGRAAQRIGIEQPPLSLQIQKIEKSIGSELFDRSNRQIRLTAVGKAFLPQARVLLEKSHSLLENTRMISRGESGVLTIGFATSTSFCGIPSVMLKYKKEYPGVELRLRELSSAAQLQELQNGTIDIGIIREAQATEGIHRQLILREAFVAVVSHLHPFSAETTIDLKDLREEPFVHFPRHVAPALYDKVNNLFQKVHMTPHIVQEALEWQTIITLVEANMGVSICPASFQKLKIGKVQYKPLSNPKALTSIYVCHNATNRSQLVQPFIKLIRDSLIK